MILKSNGSQQRLLEAKRSHATLAFDSSASTSSTTISNRFTSWQSPHATLMESSSISASLSGFMRSATGRNSVLTLLTVTKSASSISQELITVLLSSRCKISVAVATMMSRLYSLQCTNYSSSLLCLVSMMIIPTIARLCPLRAQMG